METETPKKKYNTIEVHGKRIDRGVERQTFRAIEASNHLTPATAAEMVNCFRPDGSAIPIPTRDEIIARNSPGWIPPTPEPEFEQPRDEEDNQPDWEEVKPPASAFQPA